MSKRNISQAEPSERVRGTLENEDFEGTIRSITGDPDSRLEESFAEVKVTAILKPAAKPRLSLGQDISVRLDGLQFISDN